MERRGIEGKYSRLGTINSNQTMLSNPICVCATETDRQREEAENAQNLPYRMQFVALRDSDKIRECTNVPTICMYCVYICTQVALCVPANTC